MKNNPNSTMVSFRDSFKGYNKDDVNKYLREMNRNFSLAEEEYKDEIYSLRERIKSLESKEAPVKTENGNDVENLKNEIEFLKKENRDLADSISQKNKAIEDLKLHAEGSNANVEKASMYDKMSNEIGNVFISANETAQNIITDANTNASKIKASANKEAEELKENACNKINSAIENVKSELENMTSNYISAYSELADELKANIQSMFDKSYEAAGDKLSNIDAKLNIIKTESKLKIANEISKI